MNTPMTNQWQAPGDDRTVHIPARGAFGPPPPVDTRGPFAGGGYPQTWSAAPVYPPVGGRRPFRLGADARSGRSLPPE